MPDESERTSREWLLEPLAPNEVRVHVDVGEDVELRPSARAALEELMTALHGDEVAGFEAPCQPLHHCVGFGCGRLGPCQPLTIFPCMADQRCNIVYT